MRLLRIFKANENRYKMIVTNNYLQANNNVDELEDVKFTLHVLTYV